ncbi:MAG TPA: response regulator [Candidatus Binataceae bacterium]|nr:response regulator [Candidatus Binataceae bacterium]
MRALIVDDSEAMRSMLGTILRNFGFEVLDAADATEGFAQLRAKHPVDLALVDWKMPGIDGLEFIRTVRKVPDYMGLRILMTTAVNDANNVENALAAGADAYLLKPLRAAALRETLGHMGFARASGTRSPDPSNRA